MSKRKPAKPTVYNISTTEAREFGLPPSLWVVRDWNGEAETVIAESVPRQIIRMMPRRHFIADNVVTDVDAAVADFFAKGGQP